MIFTRDHHRRTLVTEDNFYEPDYLASNPDVAQAVRTGNISSGRFHFERFGREERRKMTLTRALATDDNFNEADYLASNPDVAQAVRDGVFSSGRVHFETYGRNERRKIQLSKDFRPLFSTSCQDIARGCARLALELAKRLQHPGRSDAHRAARMEKEQREERRRIAAKYIARGDGIEIGALHKPTILPRGARVRYVDRLSNEGLYREYPECRARRPVAVDIVADGETLAPVKDGSQDFVIANQFLEHCQNPILAIQNMLRVLKPRGILCLALPDKRYSFDCARPVTPYEHLEKDYTDGPAWSRRQHFQEYVRLVERFANDAEVERRAAELMRVDYNIHFHVWTQTEMMELICHLKKRWGFDVELMQCADEVVFIIRKGDIHGY